MKKQGIIVRVATDRKTGRIKDFGFVAEQTTNEETFVHQSKMGGRINVGDEIKYDVANGAKGTYADDVEVISRAAPTAPGPTASPPSTNQDLEVEIRFGKPYTQKQTVEPDEVDDLVAVATKTKKRDSKKVTVRRLPVSVFASRGGKPVSGVEVMLDVEGQPVSVGALSDKSAHTSKKGVVDFTPTIPTDAKGCVVVAIVDGKRYQQKWPEEKAEEKTPTTTAPTLPPAPAATPTPVPSPAPPPSPEGLKLQATADRSNDEGVANARVQVTDQDGRGIAGVVFTVEWDNSVPMTIDGNPVTPGTTFTTDPDGSRRLSIQVLGTRNVVIAFCLKGTSTSVRCLLKGKKEHES